jgi:uncharacterized protein YprB with RNaseH-like and TPR domain
MTKITEDQALDWLVSKILATFEGLGFDQPYIEDKRHSLTGKDRLDVLLWCNDLDLRCKAALADRLCISADDLSVTIKTLGRL